MEVNPQCVEPALARKRVRNESSWQRSKEKRMRYSDPGLPLMPNCKHENKEVYKCADLRREDVSVFHNRFYSHKTKILQDAFILKYVIADDPSRKSKTFLDREPKMFFGKFFVPTPSGTQLRVCRQTFLRSLNLKKHRVQGIIKRHKLSGTMPSEGRGGDHKSANNRDKLSSVKKFIEKLKCCESHYCRSKTVARMYLPSELSVQKLWKMYEAECNEEQHVKESYFRKIFNTNYNLGFGTPRSDVCSVCTQYNEKIKAEKRENEKKVLASLKQVHLLKGKAFYKKLKERRPDLLTISFDCQKNQMLPRLPDQASYFSRKIPTYNFTIVQGDSKTPLNPSNVFIYVWNETVLPKGSNEIASAVFHRLVNTDFTGIKKLRLVADGCGGQNKNSTIITMLHHWLIKFAPEDIIIELLFPMVGHSFLPPDRVFGFIERDLKKLEVIVRPEEFVDIFKNYGTVEQLGSDCLVYDWKSECKIIMKPPQSWHFKFAPTKRFFLKKSGNRILIKGEVNYQSDLGQYKSITKKNQKAENIRLNIIPTGKPIAPAKINDVHNLMSKHFGDNWRSLNTLKFYSELRPHQDDIIEKNNEDCHELIIDPDEEVRV